jgi:putative addiction module killer protein
MRIYTLAQTDDFSDWVRSLKDRVAKAKIFVRIKRLSDGNMGDVKHFDGISEMRINYGPGYRLYFARNEGTIFLLLNGGDKSTQAKDIAKAKKLLATSKMAFRQTRNIRP